MVALLALCFGADGGAWNGGRATYLATNEMDGKATYLAIYEPNGDKEETYYNDYVKLRHGGAWSMQCTKGGNGTPVDEKKKASYKEGCEKGGHGRNNSSCERKEEKSWHYEIKNVDVNGAYMNVEGKVVEYDKGKEERYDMVGGMSLAGMNKFYEYISWYVYMVNFVYVNGYEYLTAELYMVMVTIYALWMWRKRPTRKRTRKARKSHLSYYKYKLRGKVLRPGVPWSEDSSRGLTEPCGVEVGEDAVLHVPVARHEKRRQRLNELCQQKKLKVVLWLAMMYSAQAMEGSPVAGSQGERVFLERVTSLTEAATAAANAATQALSSMTSRA